MRNGIYLEQITAATLSQSLAAWEHQQHLLVLLPEDESEAVPLIQACCREAGIRVAGALFPELLVGTATCRRGAILIPLIDAPPPLLVEAVSSPESPEQVALQLVDYVESNLGEDQEATLFTLFDALVPNIASHLDAWYLALADRVHYLGVNGGSERFVSIPCLFDQDRFIADGLLVQLLPGHTGGLLEHGYGVPPAGVTATSAQANRIVQIDWRPALDVYRELMQSQYGVSIDRDNFYAYAVHFPFGIIRADGEVLVRIPVALDDQDGIVCVGEIPPHSLLALLDARTGIEVATRALLQDLAGTAPDQPLLMFYCAGRRMHMGPAGLEQELQTMQAGRAPLLGALSLGEIGASHSGGYPLFHNAALVGVPWLRH